MEEIIATHIVKPSSPTPTHLKIMKLSSLDQFSIAMYVPFIFFYDNDGHESAETIWLRLRESLSEILSMFYPLAGTLRQNSFVECNDDGAEFIEARLHAHLSQFTQQPEMEKLEKLVPVQSFPHRDDLLLSVKATFFDCGGVAVAACFSHKIADASSIIMFMNAWAEACRRGETSGIDPPSFDLALRFPPMDLPPLSGFHAGVTRETIVTKRLVFEREKLEKMKQKVAASSDEVKDPSTVEAFSAFIWRSFIQAYKSRWGPRGASSFMATHAMNLRPRTAPPIPHRIFGNCTTAVSAVVTREQEESGVHVSKLRAAIRAVDDDYINTVIKGGVFITRSLDNMAQMFTPENVFFSSWRHFPMYEADFGWGRPIWACSATMPYMNAMILLSTPSGDGIEMWINLPDDDFFHLLQENCNNLFLV